MVGFMPNKTICIDQDKCTGCGLCANACHEGAIGLVDGKAKLIKSEYCDGLGACLPVCPVNAITFVSKEVGNNAGEKSSGEKVKDTGSEHERSVKNWPLQIKLVSPNAPYFDGGHILVAADCTAFAFADFRKTFAENKVVLIGCPKLDDGDYSEKLSEIFKAGAIKSVTVARMEVPCCTGIFNAVKTAIAGSGKDIKLVNRIIGIDGTLK